jgi:hypothetical protein
MGEDARGKLLDASTRAADIGGGYDQLVEGKVLDIAHLCLLVG